MVEINRHTIVASIFTLCVARFLFVIQESKEERKSIITAIDGFKHDISRLRHDFFTFTKGAAFPQESLDCTIEKAQVEEVERALGEKFFSLAVLIFSLLFLVIFGSKVVPMLLEAKLGWSSSHTSISKRIYYQLDYWFSTYSASKPIALLIITLLIIFLGGLFYHSVSTQSLAIGEAIWLSWTFVADPGTHADQEGVAERFIAIMLTFAGMLIFALMLGLVADGISEKVDSLKKGKSAVVEDSHTLILGWNDKVLSLIYQISVANMSEGGGVVVVLAEREKEDMESDIQKMDRDLYGTIVVCRSGSPLISHDLMQVSASTARSILVMGESANADESDARVLRVVLSLMGIELRGHIVAEVMDVDNEPLIRMVSNDNIETIVTHDIVGRLMIQCARQPGLARIWEMLLGFEGNEFYVKNWPQLVGKKFQEVMLWFPDAIVCGIRRSNGQEYEMIINPAEDYIIGENDGILVLAEDDNSYSPMDPPNELLANPANTSSIPIKAKDSLPSEKILFCGWRRDIDDMIVVLDEFAPPGSELYVFADDQAIISKNGVNLKKITTEYLFSKSNLNQDFEREEKLIEGGLDPQNLKNLSLKHVCGNPVARRHLEQLPLQEFCSILILADESREENITAVDSRSLATLLLIRDIQSSRTSLIQDIKGRKSSKAFKPLPRQSWLQGMQLVRHHSNVISEILDPSTKHLISTSTISDYVLSNELVSMSMAMVAEDRQIHNVLSELFSAEGNEVYLRLMKSYLIRGEKLSFWQVVQRAKLCGEIAIGYKIFTEECPVLNPPNKNDPIDWDPDNDILIVFANE